MNVNNAFLLAHSNEVRYWIVPEQDRCDHVWDGDSVYRTARGKWIFWYTFRQWARYTSMFREQLIMEHQQSIGDPVVEGTCQCSKCKAIFNPAKHID